MTKTAYPAFFTLVGRAVSCAPRTRTNRRFSRITAHRGLGALPFAGAVFLSLTFAVAAAEDNPPLTLQEAHAIALRNHPQISAADLKALAARQVTRQFRSAFLPTLSANAVAVGTVNDNTRLSAIGALNNPTIYDRQAEGLILSQLITDFGRTANLTGSAKLRAEAEANSAQATRQQILLAVDGAFYSALQAQSVTRVAQETVAERQTFLDQVSAMVSNKLKSEIDLSFAKVNLEDGKLLLSKAQNDSQAANAQLANLMAQREPKTYRLVEEPMPPVLATNVSDFVQQALQARPDVLSLQQEQEAALKFARAQRALRYPTLSAVGSAGVVPVGNSALGDNYAAGGLILTMPLYAGGLYSAKQQEAELRYQAAQESLRDLENNVVRDVRIAWLNAQNASDRLRITAQLLDNAKQSFDLAQALYTNKLSSIVEFNQAQLNLLSAQIAYTDTQYEYLLQRSALNYQTGSLH